MRLSFIPCSSQFIFLSLRQSPFRSFGKKAWSPAKKLKIEDSFLAYGERRAKFLGHGLALEIKEPPILKEGEETILEVRFGQDLGRSYLLAHEKDVGDRKAHHGDSQQGNKVGKDNIDAFSQGERALKTG